MKRRLIGLASILAASVVLVILTGIGYPVAMSVTVEPLERFAVGNKGRFLTIPVDWNGRHLHFLLDTGAAQTTIDLQFRTELGPAVGRSTMLTSAGTTSCELFACPPAKVGGCDLQTIESIACVDLRVIRYATGLEIYGILGIDFLKRYAVEIDFDRGEAIFWSAAPADWSDEAGLPLTMQDGRPTIEAVVGDRKMPFIVDTGADKSHLIRDAFDALAQSGELLLSGVSSGVTLGGSIQSTIGFVKSLAVATNRHAGLRLDRDDEVNGLGLQYLARYRLRFDFNRRLLYLNPGAQFDRPQPVGTSGLALVRVFGHTVVYSVRPGSAAAKAGMLPDDELTAIDGRSIADFEMFELRQLLTGQVGRSLTIETTRDHQRRHFTIELQSRLTPSNSMAANAVGRYSAEGR